MSGAEAVRIELSPSLLEELREHAEAAYPAEACGVLLGRSDGQVRTIRRIQRVPNRWEGRDDRYLVDPETLRELQEEEAEGGPQVVGFYHSHPEARPVPSETDREHAWPWYAYLILPVEGGRAGDGTVWELESGRFREGEIVVRQRGGTPKGDTEY